MIRVVFDTNLLLRMAAGGSRSQLGQLWRMHRFDVLISLATLTEFRTVAAYPKVQRYISQTISNTFLNLLETRTVIVQPDLTAPLCRDPKDSALIATAVGGQADFLVTADPDLLDDDLLITELARLGVRVTGATQFMIELDRPTN